MRNMQLVLKARVPIIKFEMIDSGLAFDVSWEVRGASPSSLVAVHISFLPKHLLFLLPPLQLLQVCGRVVAGTRSKDARGTMCSVLTCTSHGLVHNRSSADRPYILLTYSRPTIEFL